MILIYKYLRSIKKKKNLKKKFTIVDVPYTLIVINFYMLRINISNQLDCTP